MGRATLATSAILMAWLPVACDGSAVSTSPESVTRAVRTEAVDKTIRVGVLIDNGSPAKANFTNAALLAESQINAGLTAANSIFNLDVIVGYYGAGTGGQTQRTKAIELVNTSNVHGVVSDVSGAINGLTGSVSVNRLNYESPSAINHKIPVTCYQCSSAFFNDPAQTDLGFKDPDNWLWRTFFNARFESAVQVRLVLNRANNGDFNGDGKTKIVVYYDVGHQSAADTFTGLMDQIYGSIPHSVERIAKFFPSSPTTRAGELNKVFDNHNESTGLDDGAPDSIYLAFLPQNFAESLGDYSSYAISPKPPATANNGARRDFLLGTLVANGGEGLEGNSVRVVAASASGQAFLSSYRAANGNQNPELTASFMYDAIAAQTLAVLTAAAQNEDNQGNLDGLTPEQLRGGFALLSNPAGTLVGATPAGFETASKEIKSHKAINYDGAASSMDLRASDGEMFPEQVHWVIQGGQFVEFEAYGCDPSHPTCSSL